MMSDNESSPPPLPLRSPSPLAAGSVSPLGARARSPPSNLPQNVARNNPEAPFNDANRQRPIPPLALWGSPRNSAIEYHGYGEGAAVHATHPPSQVSPENHGLQRSLDHSPVTSRDPVQVEESKTPTHNWQASKSTVRQRLAFMYNNEAISDVHFIVGKGSERQNIPAHKFVLSIGSAVFDAMFNGGMAMEGEEIDIPDVEPNAFLALLKFLYTDEVSIGPETVMATLYVAKKYAVPALETACVDLLKAHLSPDNAFLLLTQARLFDEPQLMQMCLQTIDKNASESFAADVFAEIDHETLTVVLERDTLGIRECKLFAALCKWAESECQRQELDPTAQNLRQAMGSALQLIRFPLMTVEEFAQGPAQSGVLLDKEVVNLFLYFTVNPKPMIGFSDVPRCCLTGKEQTVSRFMQVESRWGYSGTSDRIRFMVSQRIFLVGFGLYGSIHGASEYIVNIQIIQHDTGRICGHNSTSFQCDGSQNTFRVLFKEPVEVVPHTSYLACATLNGPDSYYGTRGARKVPHESAACGKITFHFTYAAGNNNGTSVEDGQIPELIFYC